MKKHFLIFIIFWCTWGGFAAQATAFTCSKDCNEQCGSQVMGTWIVEPLCFKACKEFATLQCYNISRPWQSSMGAGEFAVESWMARRSSPDQLMFVEMIPYGETKGYIRNVWRNEAVYSYLSVNAVREEVILPRDSGTPLAARH